MKEDHIKAWHNHDDLQHDENARDEKDMMGKSEVHARRSRNTQSSEQY